MKGNFRHPQTLFMSPDHGALALESIAVLERDGHTDLADFFKSPDAVTAKPFALTLAQGARDVDAIFSDGFIFYTFHFHHPWTHRGYLTNTSAADKALRHFTRGQLYRMEGNLHLAVYRLGMCLHLLQDQFIPQHAAGTPFHGHGAYERWLNLHWSDYRISYGGYYHWVYDFAGPGGKVHRVSSENPYDWIDAASHLSFPWFQSLNPDAGADCCANYPKAAARLVPLCLRFTAGFIHLFFSNR